jgi:hypothetical protein
MAGPYPLSYDPTAFGGPGDWAMLYRAHGIQVVPGMLPSEAKPGQSWKRPVVPWKGAEFQSELVPPLTWDRWYGENGIYARRYQMGMITGQASGHVCMVDLDDHKTDAAKRWWLQLIHLHNDGRDPETWQQLDRRRRPAPVLSGSGGLARADQQNPAGGRYPGPGRVRGAAAVDA